MGVEAELIELKHLLVAAGLLPTQHKPTACEKITVRRRASHRRCLAVEPWPITCRGLRTYARLFFAAQPSHGKMACLRWPSLYPPSCAGLRASISVFPLFQPGQLSFIASKACCLPLSPGPDLFFRRNFSCRRSAAVFKNDELLFIETFRPEPTGSSVFVSGRVPCPTPTLHPRNLPSLGQHQRLRLAFGSFAPPRRRRGRTHSWGGGGRPDPVSVPRALRENASGGGCTGSLNGRQRGGASESPVAGPLPFAARDGGEEGARAVTLLTAFRWRHRARVRRGQTPPILYRR